MASAWIAHGGFIFETNGVQPDSEAFPVYRYALDLRKGPFEEQPSDPQSQREYADICLLLGTSLLIIGDFAL